MYKLQSPHHLTKNKNTLPNRPQPSKVRKANKHSIPIFNLKFRLSCILDWKYIVFIDICCTLKRFCMLITNDKSKTFPNVTNSDQTKNNMQEIVKTLALTCWPGNSSTPLVYEQLVVLTFIKMPLHQWEHWLEKRNESFQLILLYM